VLCSGLLVGAGCQSQGESPVTTESASSGAASPGALREKALAAQKALFAALSGRLMEVLGSEGPAAAIRVCSDEAPRLTQQVGEQHGVRIGRTSFRLRNPRNVPPEWARSWVEQRVSEPQYQTLADGGLGALLPIHLQPACLLCHGPREQIQPEVLDALAQRYPQDEATGFELDELRGWFWVEVPRS
jgi:hypothetical protein